MLKNHEPLVRAKWIHFFYAEDWPVKLWFILVVSLTVFITFSTSNLIDTAFNNWQSVLRLGAIFFLAAIVGILIAFLLSWLLITPFYSNRIKENGGPFQVGDVVEILVKPHRGRIVSVYSLAQGYSVRLDLGQKAKADFSDIFAGTKLLLRARPDQPKS